MNVTQKLHRIVADNRYIFTIVCGYGSKVIILPISAVGSEL